MKISKYLFPLVLSLPILLGFTRWAIQGFDWSVFIVAGDEIVNQEALPYTISILPNSPGYDGQYFYRLALNPFTSTVNELGIPTTLSYRKQRIIYPFLAYLLTFGQGEYLPFALVFINLIAFICFFYICRALIKRLDIQPFVLLLLATQMGGYIALSRDLAEILALTFIAGSLLFLVNKDLLRFIFFASLALLTREESILVIFPMAAYYGLNNYRQGDYFRLKNYFPLLPLVFFLIWKGYLYFTLGGYASKLSLFPFQGFIEGISNNFQKNIIAGGTPIQYAYFVFYGLCLSWYIITIAYAGKFLSFKNKSIATLLSFCWLIWMLFAPFLDYTIFEEEMSFGRVLATFAFVSLLLIGIHVPRINKAYATFSFLVFGLVFFRLVFFQ